MEFTGFSPSKYARMTTAFQLVMKDWAYSYARATRSVRLVERARGWLPPGLELFVVRI